MNRSKSYEEILRTPSRKAVEDVIGHDRCEAYSDIFPLLVLLYYRTQLETDIDIAMTQVTRDDSVAPIITTFPKRVIHHVSRYLFYAFRRIISLFNKKNQIDKKHILLLANSFVYNQRYTVVQDSLAHMPEDWTAQCAVAVCDTVPPRHSVPNMASLLKRSLTGPDFCIQRFFPLVTVEGSKLYKAAKDWCQLLLEKDEGNEIDDSRIDILLKKLRKEYQSRKSVIKSLLAKKKPEIYLTVGQYNLRDLLIIDACIELGIRTVQMEHHALQFSWVFFSTQNPNPRFAFAQEYYLWNEQEKKFHEAVCHYENIFFPGRIVSLKICGSPEITYEQALSMIDSYPVDRRITFMSAFLDASQMVGKEKERRAWRWRILKALYELGQRQNVKVRIRYTPGGEIDQRKEEIPTLREWGFEISESVPWNLMEDFCSSMAIFSTTSTVLSTARDFERAVYRIEDMEIPYVNVDPELHDVRIDEIPNIILPDVSQIGRKENIKRERFFDLNRILEG